MSDIVERLRDRDAVVMSGLFHAIPTMQEAAAEIERLRILVEGKPWQPIETAPKDGTLIEVKGAAGPYGVTSWIGKAKWNLPVNWHREDITWADANGAVLNLAGYRPTHWRPTVTSDDTT